MRPSKAQRLAMLVLLAVAVAVAALIRIVFAYPTKEAVVSVGGRKVVFPMTIWGARIANEEGRATFIAWGDPKFQWVNGHIEQLGSSHRFLRGGFEILVTTRKRWSWFTQIDLVVRPILTRSKKS
jgi:hypothetical protein